MNAIRSAFVASSTSNTLLRRSSSWTTLLHRRANSPVTRWSSSSSTTATANTAAAAILAAASTAATSTKSDVRKPTILDPLVVCGPSGVGKGTVITRFMTVQQEQYDEALRLNEKISQRKQFEKPIFIEFVFAVSHTTRDPRPNELDGVHYHFVTMDAMKQVIALGETTTSDSEADPIPASSESVASASSPLSFFVEHATVHGNMYGTSWDAINKVHFGNQKTIGNTRIVRKALLDIDIQGVKNLKKIEEQQKVQIEQGQTLPFLLQPKYIFIAPPNLESLQERLEARGTESKLSMHTRTKNAISEMNYGLEMLRYAFDERLDSMYRKSNNFHTVLVNGVSVSDTVDEFMVSIDRLYDEPDFQRPAHINANKYPIEEPVEVYEDMMFK